MATRGIQFVTDTDGRKVAVLLDLEEWGELWEDIYDNILADERADEPSSSLDEFEAELRAEGLLND
jgi:PHD/YefM family antitoxin component YafN of YafNO toxin-antitoxin module